MKQRTDPASLLRSLRMTHRKSGAMTLRELAKETGVSAPVLCKLESGKVAFTYKHAYLLGEYFRLGMKRFLQNGGKAA